MTGNSGQPTGDIHYSSSSSPSDRAALTDSTGACKRRRLMVPVSAPTSSHTSFTSPHSCESDDVEISTSMMPGQSETNPAMSSNSSPTQWEPYGNVELRCLACGYVGQTQRGMKMHRRLHECDGSLQKGMKIQSIPRRERTTEVYSADSHSGMSDISPNAEPVPPHSSRSNSPVDTT